MHVTMYYGNEQTSRSLQNASQFLEPHLFLIAPKVTRPHHRFTSPTLHDQEIGWSGIRMKCHATTDGERKRNNLSEKWLPWLNWKQNVAICKQNRRSNHFLAHHMQGEWTKELHLFFPWICIPLFISRAFSHHQYFYYLFNYIVSYFVSRVSLLNLSIPIITTLPFLMLLAPAIMSSNEMAIPFSPCVRGKEILLVLINTRQMLSQACGTALHAIIEDNLTWQSPNKWHQVRILFKLRQSSKILKPLIFISPWLYENKTLYKLTMLFLVGKR